VEGSVDQEWPAIKIENASGVCPLECASERVHRGNSVRRFAIREALPSSGNGGRESRAGRETEIVGDGGGRLL